MHELSVTESILDIALKHADQANATRITDLYLVIGQLSSVIDDSIQFYWDLLAKETKAEGASLHFKRLPVIIECQACNHSYTPEVEDFSCPKCRSDRIKITQGEEFFLEAIDIDKDEKR